jgi:hypothetical protein
LNKITRKYLTTHFNYPPIHKTHVDGIKFIKIN